MIITKVIGGLGNQMFQYALGYALSIDKGVPLRLDIRDFREYALHHGFELTRVFSISADAASIDDIREVLRWRAHPKIFALLRRKQVSWLRSSRLVLESAAVGRPTANVIPQDCYLEGYWQSEKYFAHRAAAIRKEFKFVPPLSDANQIWTAKIASCNAVSLHVRRGDYVTDPKAASIHGVCPPDYYREAVKRIAQCVREPRFFIFSDDVDWARANLELEYACDYLEQNVGSESYNDMRLMSMCKHHIIANSSFSWWGAWLNPREDKVVIAPKSWFSVDRDSSDIVPSGWIRL